MARPSISMVATAVLLSIVPADALAQAAEPSRTFQPTSSGPVPDVSAMLQSSDARIQAWGAWFSGRDALTQFIPQLQQIVERRKLPANVFEQAALDFALDSLIQLGATTPVDALLTVYERRPIQALILLSRAGEDANDGLLTLVRYEQRSEWFAAANILLFRRAPGFAAALLQNMRFVVDVAVTDNGGVGIGSGLGGGVFCGFGGDNRVEGLPRWPYYEVADVVTPEAETLMLGPRPAYYHRRIAPAGQAPSRAVTSRSGPTVDDRLTYVAALIGVSANELPVRSHESRSIAWRGTVSFDATISEIRKDVLRRYDALLTRLLASFVMTREEVEAHPKPRIILTVHDFRSGRLTP